MERARCALCSSRTAPPRSTTDETRGALLLTRNRKFKVHLAAEYARREHAAHVIQAGAAFLLDFCRVLLFFFGSLPSVRGPDVNSARLRTLQTTWRGHKHNKAAHAIRKTCQQLQTKALRTDQKATANSKTPAKPIHHLRATPHPFATFPARVKINML
jgi:hypothetical protein